MRIELDATRFDEGVGDFDIGHILFDTQAQRQVEIIKFSGYSEINNEGMETEIINVHLGGVADDDMSGLIEFEVLQRAVFRHRTLEPIAPEWFVDEVKNYWGNETDIASKKKAAAAEKRVLADIKAKLRTS